MKIIAITLALLVALVQQARAQGDAQSAIALAERIADAGTGAVVTIAAPPPGWSSPVPTPLAATLLGSVSNPGNGLVTLYYQTPNLRTTYEAYSAALERSGFVQLRFEAPMRGFAPPESAGVPASTYFCKGTYAVYVLAPPARPGDFRVSVWPPQPNMTQGCGSERPAPPQRANPLPLFAALPGTQFTPITSNFFPGRFGLQGAATVMSAATITGSNSLSDVLHALESQLLAADWQVSNTIVQPNAASAQLAFGSGAEIWHGLLVVYRAGQPDTLVAEINASGGSLTPSQAEALQPHQMLHVAQPTRKSDGPKFDRLLQRMFSEYPVGMPQTVYIGRAPRGLGKIVPLPGRSPVGSIAVTGLRDPMDVNPRDTLYYSLSEKELQAYFARLKARGWWPLSSPDNRGSGFYGSQEGGIASFCKSGHPAVMVQALPNPGDVNVSISEPCGALQKTRAQFAQRFGPMPPITPPPGVTIATGEPGVTGGTSGAEFRGARSLTQLLGSFTAQFVAAGWKPDAISANAKLGSGTFSITGPGGRHWQAVITVYASSSASRPQTYYGFIDLTNVR